MGFLWMFAKRFVAGETMEAAIPRVKELNAKGQTVTMDILGENVSNREEAREYVTNYKKLLDAIEEHEIDGNISLKPSMLGLKIDEEFLYNNLKELLEYAGTKNNFVRIDMEDTPYTQKTLDIFFRLRQEHKNVGIVIQAYLYRSEEDIRKINADGATVRLCKGAYKEPKELAIKKMKDIRVNYHKLADLLFKEGKYPAIATHDTKLYDWTMNYVEENKIDKSTFEFQMLYGIRAKLAEDVVAKGYNMRVYVPFGKQWFPYFYRRLRERKENIWFIMKNFFKP